MEHEHAEQIIREIDTMVRKDEIGELEVEQLLKSVLKTIVEENAGASRARD